MYVDANIFVYAMGGAHPLQAKARKALVATPNEGFSTSLLSMDEAVWALRKQRGRSAAIEAGRQILEMPGLRIAALDADVGRRALDLMEGLDPRDALHAAAAAADGAILSDDPDFDRVPGLRRVPL